MTENITIPTGMPTLSPGSHHEGEGKACVMEYVSMIAGEQWSDHPKCVHPALAAVCRAINDTVEDDERGFLLTLINRVMGTATAKKTTSLGADLYLTLLSETAKHTLWFMEEEPHEPKIIRIYTNACVQYGGTTKMEHLTQSDQNIMRANALSFFASVWGRAGKGEQFMKWFLGQFEYHTTEQEAPRVFTGGSITWFSDVAVKEPVFISLHTTDPTVEVKPKPAVVYEASTELFSINPGVLVVSTT